MTSTAAADLRVAQFADCVVLAGPIHSILTSSVLADSREPQAVVIHLDPDRRSAARTSVHRSVLLVGRPTRSSEAGHATGVAVAAPLARVTSVLLESATELTETPLVRASRALVASLASEVRTLGDRPSPALDNALVSIVRGIVDEHPQATSAESRERTLDLQVAAVIEARHTDPRLDVGQLARELHTSRRQLYRHVGEGGVATLLAQRRIATAKELLETRPDLSISDVAARSGFTTTSRLRAQFLRWVHQSPTEYRRGAEIAAEHR